MLRLFKSYIIEQLGIDDKEDLVECANLSLPTI